MQVEKGYSVFKLPNPPNFAGIEDDLAWCIIEVLDRDPLPLEEGRECRYWEPREPPRTLTYEDIIRLHPTRRAEIR